MIIRVFRTRLKPGMRSAYEQLCRSKGFPLMRALPGCVAVHMGQPQDGAPEDLVIVSIWQDLPSLKGFTGPCWQEATILPGEADLMEDVTVQHFDESYHSLVAMWHSLADVVKRREVEATSARLDDAQWRRIEPLLPPISPRGRPRADDRRTLDGILYVLRTGCRWQDLPANFGSSVTCWRRFMQWERDGAWERIWRELLATLDTQGQQAWAQSFMDSQYVPTIRRRKPLSAVARAS